MRWLGQVETALSTGSTGWFGSRRKKRRGSPRRTRTFETLEPRLPLSAAGLVPVGEQPDGALTGKIVYTSGGHGWNWSNTLGRWATDRADNHEIVEDFGNQDQMTFYADYLLRAGATVVPMRPVGRQLNEVVLDNDSPGVTFTGAWSDNTVGPRWYDEDYGVVLDPVKYRFATTNSDAETAIATYTPDIPEAGFYPVYTWVAHGSNRTAQLYRVNHTGGATEIRIDHSMVGNSWVYLGTYHFDAGSSADQGSVEISNQGAPDRVVIADAIRFGNGMGDVPNGPNGIGNASGSISGYPREDENALHWLWRAVGQGVTPSSVIGTSNVSAPARMAEHMNANTNPFGTAVYVGFHSNAATGSARGAVGLINTNTSNQTPNQSALALYTGRQINQDMQALPDQFEHNWGNRTNHTVGGSFGEISRGNYTNSSGVVEMDATIIEVAFHDNVQDAQLMRDPKVRDQLGRSTYEATIEYFSNFGGLANTTTVPSAPLIASAVTSASGEVTVSWTAGPNSPASVHGHPATGFRVYASVDGYGFDGGTFVAGGGTTTATLAGYDPSVPYYFKLAAVNAGGESHASEVLTVLPTGGSKQVLVVNGFDRYDRQQNFRYPYTFTSDGLTDRVWPRYNNSFDYVVRVHTAIHAARPGVHVESTSNDAVINGAVNLEAYHTVIWILGNESTADRTFDATEQLKVEEFLAGGGNLFVSGSEIAWDLDQQNNGRSFFHDTLQGAYVADSANTYSASGTAGGIFAGLSFSFSTGSQFSNLDSQLYNVRFPDVISPQPGAQTALDYANGAGGAAVQAEGTGGRGSVVMLGFPFETITAAADRAAVIDRVFAFFALEAAASADFNGDGNVDNGDLTLLLNNWGAAVPPIPDGWIGSPPTAPAVDNDELTRLLNQWGSTSVAAVNGGAGASSPVAVTSLSSTADDSLDASLQGAPADLMAISALQVDGGGDSRRGYRPLTATRAALDEALFNRRSMDLLLSDWQSRREPRPDERHASMDSSLSHATGDDCGESKEAIAIHTALALRLIGR